jgi:hypothetical protein
MTLRKLEDTGNLGGSTISHTMGKTTELRDDDNDDDDDDDDGIIFNSCLIIFLLFQGILRHGN